MVSVPLCLGRKRSPVLTGAFANKVVGYLQSPFHDAGKDGAVSGRVWEGAVDIPENTAG